MKLLVFSILISAAYAEVAVPIEDVEVEPLLNNEDIKIPPRADTNIPIKSKLSPPAFNDGLISTTLNFVSFFNGALTGEDACPNVNLLCKFEKNINRLFTYINDFWIEYSTLFKYSLSFYEFINCDVIRNSMFNFIHQSKLINLSFKKIIIYFSIYFQLKVSKSHLIIYVHHFLDYVLVIQFKVNVIINFSMTKSD